MKEKVLNFISACLVLVGVAISSSASFLWLYQPKTPKSMQK